MDVFEAMREGGITARQAAEKKCFCVLSDYLCRLWEWKEKYLNYCRDFCS